MDWPNNYTPRGEVLYVLWRGETWLGEVLGLWVDLRDCGQNIWGGLKALNRKVWQACVFYESNRTGNMWLWAIKRIVDKYFIHWDGATLFSFLSLSLKSKRPKLKCSCLAGEGDSFLPLWPPLLPLLSSPHPSFSSWPKREFYELLFGIVSPEFYSVRVSVSPKPSSVRV